jgi:hypothetical protein
LLILAQTHGIYAQKYYLADRNKKNADRDGSKLARLWPSNYTNPASLMANDRVAQKNVWFEAELLPEMRANVKALL